MSLGFAVAAMKLGAPIAEFLLKRCVGEGAGASGKGLIDIAASRISDHQAVGKSGDRQIGDQSPPLCGAVCSPSGQTPKAPRKPERTLRGSLPIAPP
jgi:hypothetical protein